MAKPTNANVPSQETTPKARVSYAKFFDRPEKEKLPFSTTINRPLKEVATLTKNLQEFPLFLENLEKVKVLDEDRSEWQFTSATDGAATVSIPIRTNRKHNGMETQYQAEDKAGFAFEVRIELIPAQAGRGTIVRMSAEYKNLTGQLVGIFEKLFGGDAEMMTKRNLQRLKAYCETGHVPTIDGQSSGRDEDMAAQSKH